MESSPWIRHFRKNFFSSGQKALGRSVQFYSGKIRISFQFLVVFLFLLSSSAQAQSVSRRGFLQLFASGLAAQSVGLRAADGLLNPEQCLGSALQCEVPVAMQDIAEIRNIIFDHYGPGVGVIDRRTYRNYVEALRELEIQSPRIDSIRRRYIELIENNVLQSSQSSPLLADISLARSLLPLSLLRRLNVSVAFEEEVIALSPLEYEILENYGRMLTILNEIYSSEDPGWGTLSILSQDHFSNIWPRIVPAPGYCEFHFL